MIKRVLTKLRNFWQDPLCDKVNSVNSTINSVMARRRNDQEYENKRKLNDPLHLDRFGYKVYSQNDEDGIIHEIFNRIGTTNKIFVEFGVQDGLESNCHFLLFTGWKGLWIDGDRKNFKRLQECFSEPLLSKQSKYRRQSRRLDLMNRSKRLVLEPPKGGWFYLFLNNSSWSRRLSSVSCSRIYVLIVCSFNPTVET